MNNFESVTYFKKGTVIFAEGLPSKNLYIIKSGEVRLLKDKNDKLYTVGICKDKDILNEISVLTKKNNEYSAIVERDSEVVIINEKDITTLLKSGPKWVSELLDTLCERLESVQDVIDEHQLKDTLNEKDYILTREQETHYLNLIQNHRATRSLT